MRAETLTGRVTEGATLSKHSTKVITFERNFFKNGLHLLSLLSHLLSHISSAPAFSDCSGNFPLGIYCDTLGSSVPTYVCVLLSPPSTIQHMIWQWDQHLFWLPVLFSPTCASQAHPFPLKRASRGGREGKLVPCRREEC